MIVADDGGGFRLVAQTDHADLAGQFADRWGNDGFEAPDPAAVAAVYAHDDGWWTYDRRPRLGDDGAPRDFREMPASVWTTLYEAGVASVVETWPYAGLLAAMHGAGLRRRRYGLSPHWPPTPPEYVAFVARQERRQRRLCSELRGPGGPLGEADAALLSALHDSGRPPADTESRLWFHYALLQTLDALSLSFCVTVDPPGYAEVGPVPRAPGGAETTIRVEALDDGAYALAPYPFEASPVAAWLPARTVPADALGDEATLRRAYYRADREPRTITLRRGE